MARTYLIIQASDVSSVDFSTVCETSADTLAYSVDNTKTFIKWDGETPDCVTDITSSGTFWGPYERGEFMEILKTDERVDSSNPGD